MRFHENEVKTRARNRKKFPLQAILLSFVFQFFYSKDALKSQLCMII